MDYLSFLIFFLEIKTINNVLVDGDVSQHYFNTEDVGNAGARGLLYEYYDYNSGYVVDQNIDYRKSSPSEYDAYQEPQTSRSNYDYEPYQLNSGEISGAGHGQSDSKYDPYPQVQQDTLIKTVYVPFYVPQKEKKKMKIISVDKGFFIPGGIQLFGKFKSLKYCMKACASLPVCFSGDYNPWLHKCYIHSNTTACDTKHSHPKYVHFSKVPCKVTDAPRGAVVLGASMASGIEQKGIDSLQNCIKKCVSAGIGVPAVATNVSDILHQACFAIDYDFSTHSCFMFGVNMIGNFTLHCPIPAMDGIDPASLGSRQNPSVVHMTFCPGNGMG